MWVIFLGSLSGVNFKILQLIMIVIPWNSIATSFQEHQGTSKRIKLRSSSVQVIKSVELHELY